MGKNDVAYKMNFDMAEAAKLGAATHQQSVQNPTNSTHQKPINIKHHELSDSQTTPSNFSN
jgi:hypothetical protein